MAVRKEKKEATRERLLQSASRRLKKDGIKGTSVQAVMADANLTHGSFYAYFHDKNDMVVEALRWAVETSHSRVEGQLPAHLPPTEKLRVFLRFYLSPQHRSMVADGCPISALSRDFAQADQELRNAFAKGLTATIDRRRKLFSSDEKTISREEWMGLMSCFIGALVLSRACEGEPLSDQFLESAFAFLNRTLDGEKSK